MLEAGDVAPDLTARFRDGREIRLSDLRGRLVVLYFYPKDDTPGCTTEACGLRDHMAEIADAGTDVIGVSTDSYESHRKFQEKYDLPFALASDRDMTIARAYGVGKMAAVLPVLNRSTFLIGADGKIAEVWPKVSAGRHAQEVLDAIGRHAVKA